MTRDEAVRARFAAVRLERLYNAYRATSRANAMVLAQVAAAHERAAPHEAPNIDLQYRIQSEVNVSQQSDLVYRERAEQIARRIAELDWYEADDQ